ncbi:MAG: hypothetical protein R6U68_13890 [Desulfobacteraceae bacterium]
MIKQIIRPQSQQYVIQIPKEYLNKDVVVSVAPLTEDTAQSDDRLGIIKRTAGILADRKIDPVAWQREIRSEWER